MDDFDKSLAIKNLLEGNVRREVMIEVDRMVSKKDAQHCCEQIFYSDIKSAKHAMLLSVFGGCLGLDRFYIGDKGIGIFKLIVSIITSVIASISLMFIIFYGILSLGAMYGDEHLIAMKPYLTCSFISILCLSVVGIYLIVDVFMCNKILLNLNAITVITTLDNIEDIT